MISNLSDKKSFEENFERIDSNCSIRTSSPIDVTCERIVYYGMSMRDTSHDVNSFLLADSLFFYRDPSICSLAQLQVE